MTQIITRGSSFKLCKCTRLDDIVIYMLDEWQVNNDSIYAVYAELAIVTEITNRSIVTETIIYEDTILPKYKTSRHHEIVHRECCKK
jgi:hypothetical protein